MKLFDTFRLEILETTVCFCIGMSYEEMHKYVKENYNEECLPFIEKTKNYGYGKGYFAGHEKIKTEKGKHWDFIIYLGTWEFDDYHYTTLAHEAYHIVSYLQKINGIDNREWEFLARLHTQVMNECLSIIREDLQEESKELSKDISKESYKGHILDSSSYKTSILHAISNSHILTAEFKDEEEISRFVQQMPSIKCTWIIFLDTKSQHIWVRLRAHLAETLENRGYIKGSTYKLTDHQNSIILEIENQTTVHE